MTLEFSPDATSVDSLRSWLIDWLAHELRVDRLSIDTSESFLNYGLDSVQVMTLVGDIEALLCMRLSATLAWDYPDIDAMSNHLANCLSGSASPVALGEAAPAGLRSEAESHLTKVNPLGDRDIDNLLDHFARLDE